MFYRFIGTDARFYPSEFDADGKSLMAVTGTVHDWAETPDAALWVPCDAPEAPAPEPEPAPPAPEPAAPPVAPEPPAPEPEPAPVAPEPVPSPAITVTPPPTQVTAVVPGVLTQPEVLTQPAAPVALPVNPFAPAPSSQN